MVTQTVVTGPVHCCQTFRLAMVTIPPSFCAGVVVARFKSLLKETWWLWLLFAVGGVVMSSFSLVFAAIFPISIFTFFWFAYIRYDEDGNFKGS